MVAVQSSKIDTFFGTRVSDPEVSSREYSWIPRMLGSKFLGYDGRQPCTASQVLQT